MPSHLGGHLAIVYPAQRGKVCGLGAVKAVVEAGVVAIGEGDHELPFILSYLETEREMWREKQDEICATWGKAE